MHITTTYSVIHCLIFSSSFKSLNNEQSNQVCSTTVGTASCAGDYLVYLITLCIH